MTRNKQTARKVVSSTPTAQTSRLSRKLQTKRNQHARNFLGTTTPKRIKTITKRRGDGVLREIRRYRRTAELLIPKAPFRRLVREVMLEQQALGAGSGGSRGPGGPGGPGRGDPFKIQSIAVDALQEAAEAFLVSIFEDAHLCAIHGRRITVMQKDLDLLMRIRGEMSMLPTRTA